jgi:hypothetical protein
MAKTKEEYAVSGTTEVKGMKKWNIIWNKNNWIFSSIGVFTSIVTCFLGIFWIFSLLCSTKWPCVWLEDEEKKTCFFISFYSSVGIVCMVNPDADNTTSSHTDDSIVSQRNIPASCHKHSIEKIKTVDIYFSSSYVILSIIGKSSYFMAKTNTWYYSWFILLGLCINTNRIICCC